MKVAGGAYCAAINCFNNTRGNRGLHFFRFPRDDDRRNKWIQNSHREDLMEKSSESCNKNFKLCEKHFEVCMFMNATARNRLIHNAVPTIFHGHNPPPKEAPPQIQERSPNRSASLEENSTPDNMDASVSVPQQTEKSSLIITLRKALYLRNRAIKRLQQQKKTKPIPLANVEQIISAMIPYLTKVQHSLISIQLRAAVGKVKRSYTKEFKNFALSAYHKSPSCYKFLSSSLKLPAVSTIQSWMSTLNSNNVSDENPLQLGEENQLKFLTSSDINLLPQITPESIVFAISGNLSAAEDGALEYFAGYALKTLNKLHVSPCETCSALETKLIASTTEIETNEIFLWLKRIDGDPSILFCAGQDMTKYVKNIQLVSNFFFSRHSPTNGTHKLLKNIILKYLWPPKICNKSIKEEFVSQIVRALISYKIERINNEFTSTIKIEPEEPDN